MQQQRRVRRTDGLGISDRRSPRECGCGGRWSVLLGLLPVLVRAGAAPPVSHHPRVCPRGSSSQCRPPIYVGTLGDPSRELWPCRQPLVRCTHDGPPFKAYREVRPRTPSTSRRPTRNAPASAGASPVLGLLAPPLTRRGPGAASGRAAPSRGRSRTARSRRTPPRPRRSASRRRCPSAWPGRRSAGSRPTPSRRGPSTP